MFTNFLLFLQQTLKQLKKQDKLNNAKIHKTYTLRFNKIATFNTFEFSKKAF